MKGIITIILIIITTLTFAQGRYDIWYFSNGLGIDFTQQPPVKLTNGAINTLEGSASICDSSGNLLYYSDGVTVWDKNHQKLLNGTNLSGSGSSVQAALIIKKPNTTNQYFVFSTSSNDNSGGIIGLHYSLITNEKVVQKNIQLHNKPTERITAFYKKETDSYWIATTLNNDAFIDSTDIYIYELTAKGISFHSKYTTSFLGILGQMKFSPNGKFLGIASAPYNTMSPAEKLVLFDFDRLTGEVSNPRFIDSTGALGLEFSPNSSYIYFSDVSDQRGIYQVKVRDIQNQSLENTETSILTNKTAGFSVLQLAPDGKIYCNLSLDSSLSIIENPNAEGLASNFQEQYVKFPAFSFGGIRRGRVNFGLPQFVQNLIIQPRLIYDFGCIEQEIKYYVKNCFADSILWNFGDGSSMYTISPNSVSHYYDSAGTYLLKVVLFYTNYTDTLVDTVKIFEKPKPKLGNDTLLCTGEILNLSLPTNTNGSIRWFDSDSSFNKNIYTSGNYYVTISNDYCSTSDTVSAFFINCGLSIDSLCYGDTSIFSFHDQSIDSVIWRINDYTYKSFGNTFSHYFSEPGSYYGYYDIWVKGLSVSDSFSFKIIKMDSDFLPDTDTMCEPDYISPTLEFQNYQYKWDNGSSTEDLLALENGIYKLTIYKEGCLASDSTKVIFEECNCTIWIPNSFSPNNDGINDVFRFITACDIDNVQLEIYTRWGEKLFDSRESNLDYWDGIYQNSMSCSGVYLFFLRYSIENQYHYKNGTVHLLR